MAQNIYDNKDFANEYDTMRKEEKGLSANDVVEIPIFRSMMPDVKDKSILDLGCGYGENDKYFKELGASYVLGTDISTHMIDIANKKNKAYGVEYKVLPMEQINSLKERFDIVTSSLAFHYVEDFNKLIKDIYNLLKKDGVILFSQEHPTITCFVSKEELRENKILINNKKYRLVSDYNRNGVRHNPWYNIKVEKYHRNFTTIINTLINNGFIIDEIDECTPTEEMIKKNTKYNNQYDAPYFLFIKAHKKD